MNNENNITAEFAAIDLAFPASSAYSYKIEGISNDWSIPTRTRTVNFSQLPTGNYMLHIRSGETSPEKKLFIRINPAWWQTAFFKWSALVIIIAISIVIIRFFSLLRYKHQIAKMEQERQIENIRMKISRDIHDEIGSGLTKIKLINRNLSKMKQHADILVATNKISTTSDELIQNLGEIVWTVNPANDSLENVFAFTRSYVSKWFDENPEISLSIDFTDPSEIPKGIQINPEIKRNLLLILKEGLTNSFKHSHATHIRFSLTADDSLITMHISDNGRGTKIINENSFGNGLKNMRKRAESINAEFSIESSDKVGTTIFLAIPYNAS